MRKNLDKLITRILPKFQLPNLKTDCVSASCIQKCIENCANSNSKGK